MEHIVTVRIDADDPQDGHPYRGHLITAFRHDIVVAWWLGNPRITEVVRPCDCSEPTALTITARRLVGVS
jgi:hypothetical protein